MNKWVSILVVGCLSLFFAACVPLSHETANQPSVTPYVISSGNTTENSPSQGVGNNQTNPPVSPRQVASVRMVKLGRKSIEMGNCDRGITLLERALTLNGYNPMAYYYLSLAWLKKGDAEKALTFSRKAELFSQENHGTLKKVYLLEGEIYRKLGNGEKSRWYRNRAAQIQ